MWGTKSRFHECGKIMLSGWPLVLPQALSRSLPRDKIDPPLSFPALTTLGLTTLTTLGSNLCNSAAPGGDYVTLMNNTHVLCVWLRYLQTQNRIVFPMYSTEVSLTEHGLNIRSNICCGPRGDEDTFCHSKRVQHLLSLPSGHLHCCCELEVQQQPVCEIRLVAAAVCV